MDKRITGITNYINDISKGLITIRPSHAKRIIEIATTVKFGKVAVYQYKPLRNSYELIRTIVLQVDKIEAGIIKANKIKQLEYFTKYICYDENENEISTIYIINSNLFD